MESLREDLLKNNLEDPDAMEFGDPSDFVKKDPEPPLMDQIDKERAFFSYNDIKQKIFSSNLPDDIKERCSAEAIDQRYTI